MDASILPVILLQICNLLLSCWQTVKHSKCHSLCCDVETDSKDVGMEKLKPNSK